MRKTGVRPDGALLSHVQVPRHTIRTAPRRTGRRPAAAGRSPKRARPREPPGPQARHHQAQPLGNRPHRTVASHAPPRPRLGPHTPGPGPPRPPSRYAKPPSLLIDTPTP